MHARELLELASLVSEQGPTLIRGTAPLSAQGVQQYWTASKCRLDRWTRSLRYLADNSHHLDANASPIHWTFARGVLEEILTGEVLTRVWTAMLCVYDRQCGGNEFEPLARSIMAGHLEIAAARADADGPLTGDRDRKSGQTQSSSPPRGALDRPARGTPGFAERRGRVRLQYRARGRILAGPAIPIKQSGRPAGLAVAGMHRFAGRLNAA